jgi:predicted PurR-regulated permease PerM
VGLGSPAAQAPEPEPGEPVLPSRGTPTIVQLRRILMALLVAVLLYTCYFASSLLLPILIAAFTAILLNPLVRGFNRLLVPRWLGAMLVVGGLITVLVGFGALVYEPAMESARDMPRTMRQIAPKLRQMIQPIEEASKVGDALQDIQTTKPNAPQRVEVVEARPTAAEVVGKSAQPVAAVLASVILVYFFLVFGEALLRRAVTIAPTLAKKRITVDIVRSIQADMSRYMLTITTINVVLGLATSLLMWLLGMPSPLLWGALAGLLNFAPYVGPLAAALVLGMVGLFTFDTLGEALLPAFAYLGLNALEGQFLTPLLLGNSLALNPVIILVWLMFWGWLWGIPGFLLGVPMLVCFKIICARIEALQSWSQMLER